MGTVLRGYQQRGIRELGDLFGAGHRRATLTLPCGSGKTVVAAHLVTDLGAARTVVFVPTVHLLSQTLHRLAVDNPDARLLAVCSPTALDPDDLPETAVAAAAGCAVTTDPEALAEVLTATPSPLIVAATYASSPVVAEATTTTGVRWDLLICDEAHRTAGTVDKAWALPLNDHRIPAHKRLFMTATTRVIDVSASMPEAVDSDDVQIVSMDSVSDYGPHVAPLTFRAAIDANYLSDYEIAVVAVPHRDVMRMLGGKNGELQHPDEVRSATAQLALMHTAATRPDLRSVLAFHNRISQSHAWAEQLRKLSRIAAPDIGVQCFHIDGESAPAWRTRAINALADPGDQLTVISNCKVFSEGVDVPALDAVMFAAPRTAGPDIVQIVGRAIRPHPDTSGRKAMIILPVLDYDDDVADIDTKVARTGHLAAWQVLTALAEQDELLHTSLLQWRDHIEHGGPAPADQRVRLDTSMLAEGAHLPFTLRTLVRASSPYVLTAAKLGEFHARFGHARPRADYEFGGYPLGARAVAARTAHKAGRLHPRIVALFERVPGWEWSTRTKATQRTPDQWIALVEQFVTKTGIHSVHRAAWVTAPDTGMRANIGEWVHTKSRRSGYLTEKERARLEAALTAGR